MQLKKFSSKILLFGEHIVNINAHALAIPNPNFYAQISFDQEQEDYIKESNLILNKIHDHIQQHAELKSIYNLNQFKEDIDAGLSILMNIPIGYGLGSSGAIVAAIFDKYVLSKNFNNDKLKQILGETEGVFHGKSSGLDPLVSYLNQAVYIDGKTNIVKIDKDWSSHFNIFLLDTKTPRKTEPLVEMFLEKIESDTAFKIAVIKNIIPINNKIIQNFLNNKHENTLELVSQLSKLQFETMQDFTLAPQKEIWEQGLKSNKYFLKICGAGGGGFHLCFSKESQIEGFTLI